MAEINSLSLLNDANLQGYWRFENNLNDSGPNGYTLANTGTTDTASGKYGHGRSFVAASTQYASIARASCANLRISSDQTWVCWIKQTTLSSYQSPMGLANSDGSSSHGFLTSNDSGGVVYFNLPGLTTNTQVNSGVTVLDTSNWHHIAGRYNSATQKLAIFIDGVKVGEVAASGSVTDITSGVFAVGVRGDTAFPLNALLDDAAIFNRALTDAEILSLATGNSPSASQSPSASLSPSASRSPSSSSSASQSPSASRSPSSSISSSVSPSASFSPSSSISASQSPSASISPSSSVSSSLSPSSSFSPSSSNSPSSSISASQSPSASISPSSSISSSISPSASLSPSSSISASMSPSSSISSSLSPSSSISSSVSPSPSIGFADYSRGTYNSLPVDDNDLQTLYTEQEVEDIDEEDFTLVEQTGHMAYMLHQFKNFVGARNFVQIEWVGQTTLAPNQSTVYIQIYNHISGLWDTVDLNDSERANKNFRFLAVLNDLTNYKDNRNVISCRVQQLAI